jgi:hypothetical protein
MDSLKNPLYIRANGKCSMCGTQLVIPKTDHVFLRTKGYEKDYGDGKRIIRCPSCKSEQLVIFK